MYIDKTVKDEEKGTETIFYKCPNKQCQNYGYKKKEEK